MSKSAIKNGRYTSEKRNLVMEEVKRLKMQSLMKEDGTKRLLVMDRVKELDSIIERLTNCFLDKSAACKEQFLKQAAKKEKKYIEQKATRREIFGHVGEINQKQYSQIYKMTGMDIDGRRALMSKYVPSCEMLLMYFSEYCKEVPGFRKMCLEDQKSLMKVACVDCWIIQFSHLYNYEEGTCVFPYADDLVYSIDEVRCLYKSREDQLTVWRMFKRVQMLDLTNEERAVVGGLCLMNCDADLTEEGRKIASSSTEYLLDILLQLFQKNHEPEDTILTRVMATLTEIRSVAQLCFGVQLRISHHANSYEIPKSGLHNEFFDRDNQKAEILQSVENLE